MIDDQQLLEQLAATDAYAPDMPLPVAAWTHDAALAEIERRVGMRTQERTRQMPPEYKTSRGWLVAAATFVAVLIIGTATLFWIPGGGGQEVVDQPTTTVTTDTWQRVGTRVMTPIVGLFDMIETGSGLVAVGWDPGEEDHRQNGVILTSSDGVTWTRSAEGDPALNLGTIMMYGVTDGGPGLVAVGIGCEDDAEACTPYPTVWTSSDGTSWDRSPADPDVFGERGAMLDVVATEHGIIAAGGFYTADGETELIQPTVWLSSDGIEWERVWQGEAYDFSTATLITGFQALTASADGQVVGVGTAVNDRGDFVGAIWTSTDGRSWERIDPNSEVFASNGDSDVAIQDVAWGPGGFVAVGSDGGTSVAIWHSPDGSTWNRADTVDQPFEYIGTLSSVDALGTGWVAAGPHGFSDPTGGTVTLWTSPDGLLWDRVLSIDPGYAMSVVATDSGIAVAGAMAGVDNYHAAVWGGPGFDPVAPPPDPGPTPPPIEEGVAPADEGLACEGLTTYGYGYGQIVSYWTWYERPSELDPAGTGAPCTESFAPEAVAAVFGPPNAAPVEIAIDVGAGTFTATGPAVDAGLICATGEATGGSSLNTTDERAVRRWEDLYACDDGSGSFTMAVEAYFENTSRLAGVWSISSGTGSYEMAAGGGGGVYTSSDFISINFGRVWPANEN